ncbi:M23 family metallopeptidase [Candidatus Pacearchaeota archaeon]|nr:M23 family metallopeptidase [Candidatus Pacearchaeota archaeon]
MKTKNIYSLPFKKDTLTLAVSNPEVHSKKLNNEHAIDFLIKPNTKILAIAKGTVHNVKDNSKVGGNNEKFGALKYQNYITIKHDNDEYSQYFHLLPNSSLVKKNDKVKKGQPIAKGIGMIGYTSSPHLHLEVFDENEKSLKINFNNPLKIYQGKNAALELQKSKYKQLRDAIVKSQFSNKN